MSAPTAEWRPESAPVVTYAHVTCGLCHGSGLATWVFHSVETTEICRACNGKKTIVIERYK